MCSEFLFSTRLGALQSAPRPARHGSIARGSPPRTATEAAKGCSCMLYQTSSASCEDGFRNRKLSHSTPCCQHTTFPRGGRHPLSVIFLWAEWRYFDFELHPWFNSAGRCPYAMSARILRLASGLYSPHRAQRGKAVSHEGVHPAQLQKLLRVAAELHAVPDEQ